MEEWDDLATGETEGQEDEEADDDTDGDDEEGSDDEEDEEDEEGDGPDGGPQWPDGWRECDVTRVSTERSVN